VTFEFNKYHELTLCVIANPFIAHQIQALQDQVCEMRCHLDTRDFITARDRDFFHQMMNFSAQQADAVHHFFEHTSASVQRFFGQVYAPSQPFLESTSNSKLPHNAPPVPSVSPATSTGFSLPSIPIAVQSLRNLDAPKNMNFSTTNAPLSLRLPNTSCEDRSPHQDKEKLAEPSTTPLTHVPDEKAKPPMIVPLSSAKPLIRKRTSRELGGIKRVKMQKGRLQ